VGCEAELAEVEVVVGFELIIIVAVLIHLADVLRLPLVQVGKISEDAPLRYLLLENSQHLQGRLRI
jgi:hypothetical protein